MRISDRISYLNPKDREAGALLQADLIRRIQMQKKDSQQVVVLCVGTDRATGDCLGPLVGHQLMTSSYYKVFGTLSQPVHAGNLTQTMTEIYRSFREPFVIAIDACLGSADHVGYVTVSSMPLFPGQGVDKELPPVGDISITGIVNFTSEANFNKPQGFTRSWNCPLILHAG